MWYRDNYTGKWFKRTEFLSKDTFDSLKEDAEKVRLYSKYLSGSTYVPVNNLNNIYDVLSNNNTDTWYVSKQGSSYSVGGVPITDNPTPITNLSLDEYQNKFTYEHALTLKNLFTPTKLINDSIKNYVYVDVATIGSISNLTASNIGLSIDSILLKEGHRVLVKDQISFVDLAVTIDPNTFFNSNFYFFQDNITSITYYYYNQDNGVYTYTNGALVRSSDLNSYDASYRYSVSVKLGATNSQSQYHLLRLKNGYYPLYFEGDAMEFSKKHNWIIRNEVDYNNIYDISYTDIIEHGTQSYVKLISSTSSTVPTYFTYSIPQRRILIGDFGLIINNQNGVSNIINNKYKNNLNSICEVDGYYWICGNNGLLLQVSKVDFNIKRIPIEEFNSLTAVSFFNSLNGIVVGLYNTVYITTDGGNTWNKIIYDEFDQYSYTTVIYYAYNRIFIGGKGGTFIEVTQSNGQWIFYKRMVFKELTQDDEYLLVDDINDMCVVHTSTWGLTYSVPSQNNILTNKDMLVMGCNGGNLIIYDLNQFVVEHDFMYLSFSQSTSDILSVTNRFNTNDIYYSSDNVYKFSLNNFLTIATVSNELIGSPSQSIVYNGFVNEVFDYVGLEILICGNNSLASYNDYMATTFSSIDSSFQDKIKPRLLFLDYDIASKLNFFDNTYNYVLPDSVTISNSILATSSFQISPLTGEANWISYYADREKTFQYYSTISSGNEVVFSTTFYYSATGSSYSFSGNQVTNSLADIINLCPSLSSASASRFIVESTPITPSSSTASIFLYKYMFVMAVSTSDPTNIGDMLCFITSFLETNLLVNNIYISGSVKYIYCYTDFNDTIINQTKIEPVIYIFNLNHYSSINDLLYKFGLHEISIGYSANAATYSGTSSVEFSARLNNKTAYYNMGAQIEVSGNTYSISYESPFLNFGYKPTYNIFDYLSHINQSLDSKVFLSMPRYANLPGNGSNTFTPNNIFIDTNQDTNKLLFGSNLLFEWNTIWLNTFVDVNLYSSSSTYSTTRMLVVKKYFDNPTGGYAIEFNKKFNIPGGIFPAIVRIDILSRNTIQNISDDLSLLNNIQRSSKTKSIQFGYSFTNLESELNAKFPTDSYAKIILSDYDVKKELSAIIYIDDKNELAMNTINLDKEFNINISNTGRYNIGMNNFLLIETSVPSNLQVGDGFVVVFTGGTGSSQQLNHQYFGYQTVAGILGSMSFYTNTKFNNPINPTVPDVGTMSFTKKDPFFNYEPVDLIDVGIDKNVKTAIELTPDNFDVNGTTYFLQNVDYTKLRYQLVDGLTINDLASKFTWILDSEISGAIIGQNSNGIVWYSGNWNSGRWFGGTWYSGNWVTGDWYDGNWFSYNTTYKLLSVEVDKTYVSPTASKWYDGRWFAGTWSSGSWFTGRRYDGTWNSGTWYNGIWNNGIWNSGTFSGGIWVDGTWNGGEFNCDTNPAYWLDGKFRGGDFGNGMWYNGEFSQQNGLARFGTKAFNTRTATWRGGVWLDGQFHSFLNVGVEGEPIASQIHKYSIWHTGLWAGGDHYGGIAYAINFNNGNWWGGVVEEIQIIGISSNTNSFTLNGTFNFNLNDIIYIVDDMRGWTYSVFGSNNTPGSYRIIDVNQTNDNTGRAITILKVDFDFIAYLASLSMPPINVDTIETGLRATARFNNAIWQSGIFTNGIFEGNSIFAGGIWYGGLFQSQWGL